MSVGFQLKFSLKITYVIPGKRKSVVSVVFQLKFSLEITYVTSEKRKSVVSVGFQLKFSLEITYVISGKRKSVVSVGFQLKFSLEITCVISEKRKSVVSVVFPLKFSLEITYESESESIFGPLIFFNLRYIKGGVLGYNNIGIKKCTTIFLWVLNLGQVGEILENFQNHPLGESF